MGVKLLQTNCVIEFEWKKNSRTWEKFRTVLYTYTYREIDQSSIVLFYLVFIDNNLFSDDFMRTDSSR